MLTRSFKGPDAPSLLSEQVGRLQLHVGASADRQEQYDQERLELK